MKAWIEKSIVKDRKDRKEGELKLGKALWSPTKDKRGADIYSSMRQVKKGDIILHLTDNKAFTGCSIVKSKYVEKEINTGSDWDGLAYIVALEDFQSINPPLDRGLFLSEKHKIKLDSIRKKNKVFYNEGLTLNQGAYLTEAPPELVQLLTLCYKSFSESAIPHLNDYLKLLESKKYWLYSPGEQARLWEEFYSKGIIGLGWDSLGDLRQYDGKEDIKEALLKNYQTEGSKMNDTAANQEFLHEMKPGDVVIVKRGKDELLGYGIINSEYSYQEDRKEFKSIRHVEWIKNGSWKVDNPMVLKTLTDITRYPSEHPGYSTYYDRLLGIMGESNKSNQTKMQHPLNTIFCGPPGTGKTYHTILRAAEIIENREINSYTEALSVFNQKLHNQIEFITFHQNYGYEDFIQGLRPITDNTSSLVFEKTDGVFKKIADRAMLNLSSTSNVNDQQFKDPRFDKAIELFAESIIESEENFPINKSTYIFEVEEDAFRFTGHNWENHVYGLRMKFRDLREFFKYDVKNRKDVKKLSSISGLAKQAATYYLAVYKEILKYLPDELEQSERKNYVIIIDEINRANISRVFGELITLIEPDKRSQGSIPLEARLPSGDPFMVPSNLYIIGTMNTADKSIALLDIALRRRFHFEAMYPKYEIPNQSVYDSEILRKINTQIIKNKGHDFQIGHAYFMGENANLKERMNSKVIPLLLEYFMNDEKEVKSILKSAGLKVEEDSWPLRISGKE